MNDREQRIWDAAYAAAFVADFRAEAKQFGLDSAYMETDAEVAGDVADLAVIRLRQWNRTELRPFGSQVQTKWPKMYGVDELDTLLENEWPK